MNNKKLSIIMMIICLIVIVLNIVLYFMHRQINTLNYFTTILAGFNLGLWTSEVEKIWLER